MEGDSWRNKDMTSQSENELLTRVGPGTAMGTLMRQYWLPACLSSELVADGDPLRLMLLGERLIAFRDSSGRVGVLDHRCPHRCASLFFGRNEAGGLRCVYHGWKFDTVGNCLEMPNLPADQSFRHKVKAKAYAVAERSGLVYVYMGEREVAPPCPLSRQRCCRRTRRTSLADSGNVTGCRHWKAISTPRISAFCIRARSRPETSTRIIWIVFSSSIAPHITMSGRPTGARCTRLTDRRSPVISITVSPTS